MANYFNIAKRHKYALIFAAGVATGIIGKRIIQSPEFRDASTKALASLMAFKNDAEETFNDMKENAENQIEVSVEKKE